MNAIAISRQLKLFSQRLGSLVMLFQRMPVVQMLFPEANLIGSSALGNSLSVAVTTVVGLGAYDTVAGATVVSQVAPVAGSTTVPAAVGSNLNFIFKVTGAPSLGKSWSTTTLPAGLLHGDPNSTTGTDYISGTPTSAGTYPVTITAWEKAGNTGGSKSQLFNICILGFSTQPASSSINSGSTKILTCTATGVPTGVTPTYQWYQGASGTITSPISGATTSSYTTPALTSTTSYWVKVTSLFSATTVTANSSTATITVTTPTTVSVAVSPSSVNEDGVATLAYTFTRTGSTVSALPVNFSVAGTAVLTSDYSASGSTSFAASSGTVTIPAGATTAVVTLDPVADSVVEANETAILSVTSGTGYSVGTPSSATGTITNDDTAYSSWAAALPSNLSGPLQTPQNDSVCNLLKFAFNLDPSKPDHHNLSVGAGNTSGLPGSVVNQGKLRMEYLRRKAVSNPGISYTPQFGSNLTGWSLPATEISSTPIGSTDWERVIVEGPIGNASCFSRVMVIQTP